MTEFYVCPDHIATHGWESCCDCGGWEPGDPNFGRQCTESLPAGVRARPADEGGWQSPAGRPILPPPAEGLPPRATAEVPRGRT